MVRVGDLIIDRERYLVTVQGRPVELTFMEFNALGPSSRSPDAS